jgi:hypothetical protein
VNRAAWQLLADEIARWRDAGRVVDFWWRDDDAASPNHAFNRMMAMAREAKVPLGLAVIPERAEASLFAVLESAVEVLQHGHDHRNRAAQGEKPSEFPSTEAQDSALARLAQGRTRLLALAGARLAPVLVPPWNRFSTSLIAALPSIGIQGISTFTPRVHPYAADGVRQSNAHVDLIAWRRGRTFVGEDRAIAEAVSHLVGRRTGKFDASEATGWLTHHACHDETIWSFLARLFEQTSDRAAVRWLGPMEVFFSDGKR